jgi:7,8-dihydropterin-6-yl-methyl-4-(beta-D-ribofuranosyl)aminobenzene 5'-phosphate synthase
VPEPIRLEPVDAVSNTVLADATADLTLADRGPARRAGVGNVSVLPAPFYETGATVDAPLAEPGFSALVTVVKDGREHRILFDAGVTPTGVLENMRRLDLDPADIEAIVFSHGHFDHTGAVEGLVARLGRTNLPVFIHPEFWNRRRVAFPGRQPWELPTTSRAALEGAGFEIVEQRRPSFLFERSVLVTGEVDRTTPYERGFAIHECERDGRWQPDPLILDDQAIVLDVRGEGLVVLTGCGHAGIVNIGRYACALTDQHRITALVGGFHLNGPLFEPIIPDVVAGLAELAPGALVPAHCSGPAAQVAIAHALPDAWVPSAVGTTFTF